MSYPVYSQPPLIFDVENHTHKYDGVEYTIFISIAYTPSDENGKPEKWAWRDTVVWRHVPDRGRFISKGNISPEFWDTMDRNRAYDTICAILEASLERELNNPTP